jgi:virginiamycin B lyase
MWAISRTVRSWSTTYPRKNSAPIGMASDAHGTIWFAEYAGRKIGRLDAVTGTFTEYPIPANGVALELTAGAGGNTWFTVVKSDAIGRISERGEITEFQIPTPRSGPFAIGIGPDDAIWFAERGANKIARATLQGRVTNEYPVPTPESGAHSIVDGPNHDVWFTEFATNKLASITTN